MYYHLYIVHYGLYMKYNFHNFSLVAMHTFSTELWFVPENHDNVKPDLNVASHGMKSKSKSKIELQNLQILKKMLEKSSQLLSSEQPCEQESVDVALNIAGVEIIRLENLQLWSTLKAIWFKFWMKEHYWQWKVLSCVVGDSQISLTYCQRHLIAAIKLALSSS